LTRFVEANGPGKALAPSLELKSDDEWTACRELKMIPEIVNRERKKNV
jgi:hypothetical protein